MRDFMHLPLVTVALLFLLPGSAAGQISMQRQMPGYSNGPSLSASANRNLTDAPSRLANSELRVVPADFAKLILAPGFLVQLNVLDDSDFTGDFRIDELGNITVPVVGTMHIAGQTASEARTQIVKQLLEGKFLKDPQLTLKVLEYTAPQVTIIGEVGAPGKYPLLVPSNLVDVLALAGGPTPLAGDQVQIISGDAESKSVLVHYSKASDPKEVRDVIVNPGDTVQMKRAGIVYVLGAVNRPGGYVMQEEGTLNVLQAVSLANGTSIAASSGTIYVLRRNADGTEVDIAVPYQKISRGKSADIQLHPTDVLFVPSSAIKSVLINSQGIIAAAASASIYVAAVH